MKAALILALGLFITATSFASERLILNETAWPNDHEVEAQFEINSAMGRAWVKVMVTNDDYDLERTTQTYDVKVKGLSYKVSTKEIIIQENNSPVVCAKVVVKGRSIFRRQVIRLTGNCVLRGEIARVPQDDGFRIRKSRRVLVYLSVK